MLRAARVVALSLAITVAVSGCAAQAARTHRPRVEAPRPSGAACRTVVVAAGDIVNSVDIANKTGRLAAAQHPDAVLVLGDNQYDNGSLASYEGKYNRTEWGRLKPITKPVPGNHDYLTRGAAGYFDYFGHPPAYYAFDAGCGWRAYALDSEIDLGTQVSWLRRDLAAHPDVSVLAFWHTPRWSSGTEHGSNAKMQPLWDALAGRRGVVLNGHEHNYERFAPIGGLREFVAGTGGSSDYPFGSPIRGSQRRIADTPGVLRLTLLAGARYAWAFLNVSGATLDSGSS